MESFTWMVASLAYDKKQVKGSRPNSGNTRRSIEDDDYDDEYDDYDDDFDSGVKL